MKKLIGLFVFAMTLSVGVISLSYAAADMAAPGPQSIKGDLLKIEGEFYVVHDTAGHEVRLHVDKTTKLDGSFKTGDKVEAQVTDKGHAFFIKHANVASGGMAALGSQTVKGDLLKIEGEFYVVHDTAGHEVQLHIDKTTKLDGNFKAGDKVEAEVTDKSHALSLKHANPAR
jgi:DNA-binding sugar fermentation-stimulating protein